MYNTFIMYQILRNFIAMEINAIQSQKRPFKCYVTLIFDTHRLPRNTNNVDPYIFVMLFSRKYDTLPPPTALRNTWMAPKRGTGVWRNCLRLHTTRDVDVANVDIILVVLTTVDWCQYDGPVYRDQIKLTT